LSDSLSIKKKSTQYQSKFAKHKHFLKKYFFVILEYSEHVGKEIWKKKKKIFFSQKKQSFLYEEAKLTQFLKRGVDSTQAKISIVIYFETKEEIKIYILNKILHILIVK